MYTQINTNKMEWDTLMADGMERMSVINRPTNRPIDQLTELIKSSKIKPQ